jgi:hypothetical protein
VVLVLLLWFWSEELALDMPASVSGTYIDKTSAVTFSDALTFSAACAALPGRQCSALGGCCCILYGAGCPGEPCSVDPGWGARSAAVSCTRKDRKVWGWARVQAGVGRCSWLG